MDDFDHSIHITENDWSSFYDESEECDLLQPSLACLDDSDLSDSGNPDQQETHRRPDANSCTKLPEQLNPSGTRESEEDAAISTKQGEIRAHCPGENSTAMEVGQKNIGQETSEEARGSNTNTLQTEPQHEPSSNETRTLTEDGGVQSVSDFRSTKEPGLLYKQIELSVSEPDSKKTAEKERWFVTVNENLSGRRGRSTTVKKKAHEGGLTGTLRRPKSSDKVNDKQESENKRKIQSNQSIALGKNLSDDMKVDLVHTVKSQSQVLDEDAESLPVHSSDSGGCLSAAESVQEAQRALQDLLTENLHFHCSLSLTCGGVTENTGRNRTHSRQMSSQSTAAASCKCYETTTAEPSVTSPPCQTAAEMPEVNSPCENDTHTETSGPLTVANRGSTSASSQEDQLTSNILPLTACPMADSPETYAKAAGQTKPVYAISAFWDEMERLTINNILQVKKRSCLSSKQYKKKTCQIQQSTAHWSMLWNMMCPTAACWTRDGPDSDYRYSSQPDESQSDHCSELLTSDFDEEYWKFVGASRNPNTDPHCQNQQSPSSSSLHRDDATSFDGTETLVPLGDNRETQILTSWPRQMYTVQAFETEDLSLLPFLNDRSGLSLRRWCLEVNAALKPNYSLEALNPASFLSHTDLLDAHHQMFFPELVEYYFTESEANSESGSFVVYNPEETFAAPDFNSALGTFVDDATSFSLQTGEEQPIPIFSCSHPPIRELTFPKQNCVFLRANCEKEDVFSSFRLISHSLMRADLQAASAAAAVSGYHRWRSSLWIRKIHFPNTGSFWMFQGESEEVQSRRENPTVGALSEGKVTPDSSQVFRELEEQRESIWRTSKCKCLQKLRS